MQRLFRVTGGLAGAGKPSWLGLIDAGPAAVAAGGLVAEAAAAALAGHLRGAGARALEARGGEFQLKLPALAAGTLGSILQDARGRAARTGARQLGVGALSCAFPASNNHFSLALADVAVEDQVAGAFAPEALDPVPGNGWGDDLFRRIIGHLPGDFQDRLVPLLPLLGFPFLFFDLSRCLCHVVPFAKVILGQSPATTYPLFLRGLPRQVAYGVRGIPGKPRVVSLSSWQGTGPELPTAALCRRIFGILKIFLYPY